MIRMADRDEQLEKYVTQEELTRISGELITCPDLSTNTVGTIIELSKNHAKSVFIPTNEMIVDEQGLVYDGFVLSAANYVAQAAINRQFSVLISSQASCYSPLKLGEILEFEAQALYDETSRKREVRVVGRVSDVKVFESQMQMVTTNEHIFNLKRPDGKNASDNVVPPESKLDESALAPLGGV